MVFTATNTDSATTTITITTFPSLGPADEGDLADLAKAAEAAETGKPQRKDNRKRNSLVTDIIDFSENKEGQCTNAGV